MSETDPVRLGRLRHLTDMSAAGWVAPRLGPQFSGVERRSPQLTWPSDHAWCVATEVDFDSTLVGGSHDLITAVVADRALEALPIDPDGRLTSDTDTINDPDGARGQARYDPEGDTDRELALLRDETKGGSDE